DLQGHVVLIHFWDYASAGSLRSLAYVKSWLEKYGDYGLTVIGVHTPEFHFGTKQENVQDALKRLGIEYPVLADNQWFVWTAYGNRVWPTVCLVDKDGFIRFTRAGEGGYDQVERMLQALLTEAGIHGELPDFTPPIHDIDIPGVLCYRATGDIALGYLRGPIGNPEGFSPESTLEYAETGLLLPGRVYLKGKWRNERECMQFAGQPGEKGTASVRYEALEVNAVLAPEGEESCSVQVLQGGVSLQGEIRGGDVRQLPDGSTSVLVERPGLFHLVRNKAFGESLLTLTTSSPSLQIYQVSFVTSPIPEALHTN
ncbi:MAG: redoxin domain-containing protein, partial [Ignavibacteriales bacterium]|nr:redoxin domain-containing protein [Ignavibacteriales bacterium]